MLRIDDHDRVRLLTLDRPEALNAFNAALYDAGRDALLAAAADDDVAVVVITGEGRAFSAGQDLLEMAELASQHGQGAGGAADDDAPADQPGGDASGFSGFLDALQSFPKPLVAAVNGLGLGIGFTMLAHCDLVLIAEGARLKTPFTSLGVSPEAASSYLFPMRMGWQRAAKILFTSDWISAEEAVEVGIALQVCAPDALLPEALELAGRIARMPISSLVTTKRVMLDAQLPHIRDARAREEAAFVTVMGGPANIEALTAFAEKREPDFAAVDDRPPAVQR
ncbi:MAG: enoyl-CoA hydratase/isomerase family protein [Acidimicrobiales bacterium]